ncbi:MAG: nitroreductase family protein [Alphaproteobacteria bacterium]
MSYEAIPLPNKVQLDPTESLFASRQFLDFMKRRHSVRDYSKRPVSEEIIKNAIATAGRAPSGANQQPWHFAAIKDQHMKSEIRDAAEQEEEAFYAGGGGDAWIRALEPIGTGVSKPHLTNAPWLIVVFAQRYGFDQQGKKYKHYYVSESVGIATGMLVTALHHAGLVCLTHTPNPMKFLNQLCERPINEKPLMIIPVGYPAQTATIPKAASLKKPLSDILSIF